MRIVAALGGNALLERGEPPESGIQEAHVIKAVRSLAPLAAGNDLAITHSLLARELNADALLLLTDVAAVQDGYGTPQARPIRRATPAGLRARAFPAGSMGPKVEAACQFVDATGKPAAIGRLGDAQALLTGQAGTLVAR
jgi:carbamate kinase